MSRLRTPPSERDHVRGSRDASITLVEYGDFQCPYCGQAYWVLKRLEQRFRNDLLFVFRHFPLTQVHPYALIAAEAAESAEDQFWEMHGLLFENQPALAPEDLVGYASELGLDTEAFVDDLESHRHRDRVREDFMSGVRSGVNGTPCLFINDQRWNGPVDEPTLARAFEALRAGPHAHP
jgi:protein-disulfide isomerase